MLTKLDIAAIRHADDMCVHLNARHPTGLVRLIQRRRITERDPFAQDKEHVLTATVELHGFRGKKELEAGHAECFAMAGFYHNQYTSASLAMKSLRVGDEVTFAFWPDAHTNGYVAAARLHADVLYMHVRRNGKTIARWQIESSVCPSNSARMCKGIPNSETYERDAEEARKVHGLSIVA
jgi:hypothetical protein